MTLMSLKSRNHFILIRNHACPRLEPTTHVFARGAWTGIEAAVLWACPAVSWKASAPCSGLRPPNKQAHLNLAWNHTVPPYPSAVPNISL